MDRFVLMFLVFVTSCAIGLWGLPQRPAVTARFQPGVKQLGQPMHRLPAATADAAGQAPTETDATADTTLHLGRGLHSGHGSLSSTGPTKIPDLRVNQVLQVRLPEREIVGRVLGWDDFQVAMLSNRGVLHYLPWREQLGHASLPGRLQPLSAAELQAELSHEFGSAFVVRGSAQFVVVQPRGSTRDWARSMQQFYGNVQTYCSARRIPWREPSFPLVAIVMPSRQAMLNYAAKQQEPLTDNILAYFSVNSNRVIMYDTSIGRGKEGDSNASLDLATVFHEAFHQIAFNVGLHHRTVPPPLWVSEGLAAAFETDGLADHRRSRGIRDRLNPIHCRLFQDYSRQPGFARDIAQLLANDEMFRRDPDRAYALAWGMAFYWLEQAPDAWALYLQQLNQHPPFEVVPAAQRRSDFGQLMPGSSAEFAARLAQYYRQF